MSAAAGASWLEAAGASPYGVALALLSVGLVYVLLEQLQFRWTCKQLPSPPGFFTPLIGGVVDMVCDPYGYWERQRLLAPAGISKFFLLGKTVFFSTDTETSRHILMNNGPDSLMMAVHPSGKWILGPNNLAFMHGPGHKALRRSFLSLFTTKALGVYVTIQDAAVKRHIDAWLADPELRGRGEEARFGEMRDRIRDMNQETSQDVFVGPYLPTSLRAEFGMHYRNMTDGFLSLPLPVPGTAVWRGMQSRKAVIRILTKCSAAAKERLKAGGRPECLLDFWVEYLHHELAQCAADGKAAPAHSEDVAVADTIMDFLFASQDASTASLTWLAALLCDHPDVAARVRAEVMTVMPSFLDADAPPIDGESLYRLTYTRQVAKEALRWRPAAPMVPQVAAVDFPLADGVVAPKGSLVIPSLMAGPLGSGQGFPNGEMFDPERMSAERAEDVKHAKHFLTFGCGPHACVGQQYAINHLVAFAARLAASVDLKRQRTAESDDFLYLPTVYPKDCLLNLQAVKA